MSTHQLNLGDQLCLPCPTPARATRLHASSNQYVATQSASTRPAWDVIPTCHITLQPRISGCGPSSTHDWEIYPIATLSAEPPPEISCANLEQALSHLPPPMPERSVPLQSPSSALGDQLPYHLPFHFMGIHLTGGMGGRKGGLILQRAKRGGKKYMYQCI